MLILIRSLALILLLTQWQQRSKYPAPVPEFLSRSMLLHGDLHVLLAVMRFLLLVEVDTLLYNNSTLV